eukprot:359882-Chlamydomonas_euryale.AAC.3
MAGLSQLSCRQAWQCGPGVGLPPTDSAAAFFRSWPGLLLPHCNSLAHRRRGQCTHAATWQGAANRLCESVACDCGRTRGGKHSVEGEEGRTLAMFILSSVEDDVRVKPEDLSKHPLDAVTDVLERQYLDKVLPGLGLAVTLYDVQSIEGGFIYPNDGAAYFKAWSIAHSDVCMHVCMEGHDAWRHARMEAMVHGGLHAWRFAHTDTCMHGDTSTCMHAVYA